MWTYAKSYKNAECETCVKLKAKLNTTVRQVRLNSGVSQTRQIQ
jgi:hypothetical protein